MVDPAGNETDYTYGPGGETSETAYIGCASGTSDAECIGGMPGAGSILKATTTTYDTRNIPLPYGDSSYPIQYSSYPIATSTAFNGSTVGNTTSSYQGAFTGISWECNVYGAHTPLPPTACITPPGSSGTAFLVGQPHETDTYQGSGTGTLLKSVMTIPVALNSGSCGSDSDGNCYWTNNLLGLATEVETFAGGATQVDFYCYDESSPSPTETSCSSPSSTHGHPTTTFLDATTETHTSWNGNGMPASIIDANGHTTSYAYDATGLNIHTITHPDSEVDTYTFDTTSNQVTQHIDSNGGTTNLTYDAMRRPWSIQYPDVASGTSQVACYPSATSVQVYQAQGSALPSTSGMSSSASCPSVATAVMMTANVDGLGRTTSKIARAPEGNIETDTLYDAMGRAYATSTPYLSSGSPSSWTVTSAYDALSRPLSVYQGSPSTTSPSGDRKQWSYAALSTTAIDENGNQTKTTNDFLDRIVEVDEPLTNGSSPTTIPTTYSYNVHGLTNVTQTGISGTDTARTRSFVYDDLGRLTWSTNPEAGTICYGVISGSNCTSGYDGNGNLVKKTDARGVVITYAYDNMNRLTGKTYSGGATLSSCYQYGTSSGTNGRLINEWTISGSCASSPPTGTKTLNSILAYDVMGRVVQEQQCSKTLCSIFTPTVTYSYDLAGKTASYSSGFEGFYFSSEYDQAGRSVALTSSWNDPTHPSLLWSATDYSPAGLTGAAVGQHLDLSRSYDSRLRISSNIVQQH